jgi:hypothetical protein
MKPRTLAKRLYQAMEIRFRHTTRIPSVQAGHGRAGVDNQQATDLEGFGPSLSSPERKQTDAIASPSDDRGQPLRDLFSAKCVSA